MSYNPPIEFVKKDSAPPATLEEKVAHAAAARLFPLLVTKSFAAKIDWNDPADPLLRQILPTDAECEEMPGFVADPLQEADFKQAPGILKKYHGRVIMQLTGACPLHCRYCFRRHNKNIDIPGDSEQWRQGLEFIRGDDSVVEVIFSGGDPLMLAEEKILGFVLELAAIPHLKRLRIHTRVPVASPERVTPDLIKGLRQSRLTVTMVIHMNHPNEMDQTVKSTLGSLVDGGIPLYNQSVLLKGVNDSAKTLIALSETLIEARVTPYYLHILDQVAGAAHFFVPPAEGRKIIEAMRRQLPGFAVPLLVQEIPGDKHKLPV